LDSGAVKKIYDWDSFLEAVKTVWTKDPSLVNLYNNIEIEELRPMFDLPEIQNIINNNQTDLYEQIEKEVVARAIEPLARLEIDKRVAKIYERRVGKAPEDIKKIKIRKKPSKHWLRKKHAGGYVRKGIEVKDYFYTPRRKWVSSEMRFLIQRMDKKPKEVIGEYKASPLAFRTTVSVRNKFYRVRRKMDELGLTQEEFIARFR
jgi:hypothetical protein